MQKFTLVPRKDRLCLSAISHEKSWCDMMFVSVTLFVWSVFTTEILCKNRASLDENLFHFPSLKKRPLPCLHCTLYSKCFCFIHLNNLAQTQTHTSTCTRTRHSNGHTRARTHLSQRAWRVLRRSAPPDRRPRSLHAPRKRNPPRPVPACGGLRANKRTVVLCHWSVCDQELPPCTNEID